LKRFDSGQAVRPSAAFKSFVAADEKTADRANICVQHEKRRE
jgi:hypothetical protein